MRVGAAVMALLLGGVAWVGRRGLSVESDSSHGPKRTTTTRPHWGEPPKGKPLPQPKDFGGLQWNLFAQGPRSEREIYLGDVPPGTVRADLYVLSPGIEGFIHFANKRGKDNYGWDDPPPGGSPIIQASVDALNAAVNVVAPVADAALASYGVPPGVVSAIARAVGRLLDVIPDAVERWRVEQWTKWREGDGGEPAERARIKAEVARWRDRSGLVAKKSATLRARYHWRGSGPELPLVPLPESGKGKPIVPVGGYSMVDQPRLRLQAKSGTDWRECILLLPATDLVPLGERRYVFVLQSD
jgi:hypothetical protein